MENKFVITEKALNQLVAAIGSLQGEVNWVKINPIIEHIKQSFTQLPSPEQPQAKELRKVPDTNPAEV